jgi:hypothetical protein
MTLGSDSGPRPAADPSKRWMFVAAAILLAIPLVALMWVSSYAKETPRIGGFPFFFWYQFLWVFICSAMTYAAHRLVLAARKKNGGRRDGEG